MNLPLRNLGEAENAEYLLRQARRVGPTEVAWSPGERRPLRASLVYSVLSSTGYPMRDDRAVAKRKPPPLHRATPNYEEVHPDNEWPRANASPRDDAGPALDLGSPAANRRRCCHAPGRGLRGCFVALPASLLNDCNPASVSANQS